MFPYRDENPTELTPFLTVGFIGLNVLAWLFIQGMGLQLLPSVCEFGLIPAELTGSRPVGRELCEFGGLRWGTLLTSMFMHGGWLHLGTNMMFLWVFGNNVEDSMGHIRYVVFYLLVGVAASGLHIALQPGSAVPTVGASGAISGVLGAYMLLYPRVRVDVFLPPFWVLPLPAFVVLGYWIVIQLFMGMAQLGGGQGSGGVAVWAHIGGFFAGLLLVRVFERPQLVSAKREGRHLDRAEIREGRYWW